MFKPGADPRRHMTGRPKGSSNKSKLEELLGAERIDNALLEDFENGDKFARQLVYEHFYGKPLQNNKNENTHEFPAGIDINLIRVTPII